MRPVFVAAPSKYDPADEARYRDQVAAAIAKCLKVGADIELGEARTILTTADGTRYALEVTDAGIVRVVDVSDDSVVDHEALLSGRLDLIEPHLSVVAERSGSTLALTAGSTTTLVYNSELEDTDGGYDTATGLYTVTTPGKYLVTASAAISCTTPANSFLRLEQSGNLIYVGALVAYSTNAIYGGVAGVLDMTAGQNIRVRAVIPSGVTSPVLVAQPYSRLHIERMKD